MSTTLQRPASRPTGADHAAGAPTHPPRIDEAPTAGREGVVLLATLALLVAASLSLTRVFVGLDFLRPVLGSALLAVGVSWGARRLGAGPLATLLASFVAWVAFVSAAFFADSLVLGVVPTPATAEDAVQLWRRGLELMQLRPSPTFAEAGLVFITVTGVWAVGHAVEGLVFRLAAPARAIAMALVLWIVPLTVAPPGSAAWVLAVPFLAAAALLLLSFAGTDLGRWGLVTGGGDGQRTAETALLPSGGVIAVVAIILGALVAGVLPGFGDPPWYELRGVGGTTLTTNPIVDIRSRLVATDTGPVLRVVTDQPVYLRTTGLDVYGEAEEWTNSGIRGAPIDGAVPLETPIAGVAEVRATIEVTNLPEAVLVPAPYQTVAVDGDITEAFQYDRTSSTMTLDRGVTLQPGNTYDVVVNIPKPDPEQLQRVSFAQGTFDPRLVQLPGNVPDAVGALARQIVDEADAGTKFEQALAIQRELRSWTYSTDPPPGHSGQAMESFLASRTGYCEQYAGTMAVMLRTLGIPSRVAVGFTPGDLVAPAGDGARATAGEYVVTNANAHSWVEVLFPGLGWISFEPTPRGDGNVLVPTPRNLAPNATVAQRQADDATPIDPVPREQDLQPRADTEISSEAATAPDTLPGGGDLPDRSFPFWLLALLGIAGLGLVGLVAAGRSGDVTGLPAGERVLRARDDVERVGRGLGMPPVVWETDLEYLRRIATRGGAKSLEAAGSLGTTATRARYAPTVDAPDAAAAEQAARVLRERLLTDVPAWRRALVRVRASLAAGVATVAERVRGARSGGRGRR